MTLQDKIEFNAYLRQCTDKQLHNVYLHELNHGRVDYAALAKLMGATRQLHWATS
jgi:hypothetical protein